MKYSLILMITAAVLSLGVVRVEAEQPLAGVAGYVFDSNSRPVGKAFVEFTVKSEYRGLVSFSTMTDETGKYRIERLPAGSGWAKVDAGQRGRSARRVTLEPNMLNIENFRLQ